MSSLVINVFQFSGCHLNVDLPPGCNGSPDGDTGRGMLGDGHSIVILVSVYLSQSRLARPKPIWQKWQNGHACGSQLAKSCILSTSFCHLGWYGESVIKLVTHCEQSFKNICFFLKINRLKQALFFSFPPLEADWLSISSYSRLKDSLSWMSPSTRVQLSSFLFSGLTNIFLPSSCI